MHHRAARVAVTFKRALSDSQALTALGAPSIDNGTAATGFHPNQKAMGTGATGF